MTLNPFGSMRDRLNEAVSARVNAQLDGRDAAIAERLAALEESISATHVTLATLQRLMADLSATISDRVRTIEIAQERTAPNTPSAT